MQMAMFRNMNLVFVIVFSVVKLIECGANILDLDFGSQTYVTVNEWFNQINSEYEQLNRHSASYMWELNVNPTIQLTNEAGSFGGIRARWIIRRCKEAQSMLPSMTRSQERMIMILCRGPKYTNYQGSQLSDLLTRIQEIYTETQVCLPSGYDVCINSNRIWEYTYVKGPSGEILPLNLSSVVTKRHPDSNPLHYFDGFTSPDYYVFRGVQGYIEDEVVVDRRIRKSQLICLGIEPDLEHIMAGRFEGFNRMDCALPADLIFRWAWESWRLAVGPDVAKLYPNAVYFMNLGAQNNGYRDIGAAWRDELEIDDLEQVVDELWKTVKPYYQMLHSVLRNALWIKYEEDDQINQAGPIPAHILGNMWSQDWSPYHKLLVPFAEVDLDENLKNTNWSSIDMVKRADDFYSSMGLNPMPSKFWKFSQFDKTSNGSRCHGSAANMFNGDDYRMIVCAERTFDDFYVIVHEMGHLHYYMHANPHQPPIFQDATNSAMGESIGDAIYLAMMTPAHLNRLGLLDDRFLFTKKLRRFDAREIRLVHESAKKSAAIRIPTKGGIFENLSDRGVNVGDEIVNIKKPIEYPHGAVEETKFHGNFGIENDDIITARKRIKQFSNAFDLSLLLKLALSKIPQIPFEYILDVFRWRLFDGSHSFENANEFFWKLSVQEQGIKPPNWEDRSELFDAAAKFHFADNTPYVRYFLASLLQVQIFKGLCEMTIFGQFNTGQPLPMALHRCDIYGSKRAGNILKKALNLGASRDWREVLHLLTGSREVSVEPFIEYYQPLFEFFENLINDFEIPIGWQSHIHK